METTLGPDGNRIAFEVEGDGSDLILLHGITENRNAWGGVRRALARHHRVIAVDLRGHGDSDPGPSYALDRLAADVAEVSASTGSALPSLVGHSLGGAVASVYAATYPTRAVVNIDQPLQLAAFQGQLRSVEGMLRDPEAFGVVIGGLFDTMMGPLAPEERERLTRLRRPDQTVVLGVWDPILSMEAADLDLLVRDLLAGISCDYLSLSGIDPGPEYSEWLSDVIPEAVIEVWQDSGHYPHLAHPERFVERVRSFVG